MSFYNFAYTAPFPKGTKITGAQVFEALRVKTRDPVKFIPAIVGSEVLEETPTSIKRTMTTRDGATITGDIDLYAPSFVTFKGSNGSFVINSIAEDDEGHMSLTFLFSFPIPKDIGPGSEEEAAKKQEFYKLGKEAVHKGVATTLEMFEAGKL